MSPRRRQIGIALLLAAGILLLTGCGTDMQMKPIDPNGGFWDRYFVYPLSWSLDWFADLFWGEYGLAILAITIVIRTLILPLSLKQYKSSRAMQALQPEIKKIQEKYKNNPQKQQEETMKLFQMHGVNPLAGCFPLLIQMPVLFALFHAIYRNEEIRSHSFLWMQLGEADPYYILPLLAALATYVQQKMMADQTPPQMRSLMIIFPILIFVMSMSFASALPLYWFYSNLYTLVQSYFMYGGFKKKGTQTGGNQSSSKGVKSKGGLSK